MKLILTSDWHLGLTKLKAIEKMLSQIREHCEDDPEIVAMLILGDFCGGKDGARSVASCLKVARNHLPLLPIVVTMGNHDYWCKDSRSHPSALDFQLNYSKILASCKLHDVHFLDRDGPYRPKEFMAIVGHTMWYQDQNPPSNDHLWLPSMIDGRTIHNYLSYSAQMELTKSLGLLTPDDSIRIFASHFPIVPSDIPGDDAWSGPTSLYAFFREQYSFSHFLNGHTHKLMATQGHWCVNSDYMNPKYIVVEI